ncbi:MAG: dUTP diphosphatase [Candidatus Actinomarina sp.]|tara:strand:- start:160 stop:591 length:432 start_codon:yes stop_codon:yes gene_type:complete
MSKNIQIKLLTNEALVPKKQHELDIGYDLASVENLTLLSKQVTLVRTGLSISLPAGVAGFVLPRSGLATKHQITLINSPGLIDPGYTGEILIPLINHSDINYNISKQERVAQLVLVNSDNVEFDVVDELNVTERSSDGFGSTG